MGSFNIVLLLLSVWASLALCGSFEFTSNFSSSQIKNNGWDFRGVQLSSFNLPLLWLGANFRSADITGNINAGSVDVVTGSAYVALGGFPFSFLSYFKANYNLDIGAGQNFANANVSAAAGYVGTAYLSLEESTPNGTIVAVRSLEWLADILNSNGLSYTLSESKTDANAELQYVTYTGASNVADDLIVKITFLVSSVAGIVNNTIAIVPRSLESVISITGYPYQNTRNSLSLVLGVGTGGATVSASGKTIHSQGNAVYFSLSDSAVVGGSVKPVSVSAFSSGDADLDVGNTDFSAQLSAKYGASVNFSIVKITYPPGAANIVYDPSLGTGVSAQESSAPLATASLILFMAAILSVVL